MSRTETQEAEFATSAKVDGMLVACRWHVLGQGSRRHAAQRHVCVQILLVNLSQGTSASVASQEGTATDLTHLPSLLWIAAGGLN